MSPDDAGADAAIFTPAALPNLVLWLDARAGIAASAAKVSEWQDQSAHGYVFAQGSADRRPSLATDTTGRASVAFSSNTYLSKDTEPALELGTDDFLVELVTSAAPTGSPNQEFFDKVDTASPYTGIQLYAKADGTAAGGVDGISHLLDAPSTNLFDGQIHVFGLQRSGTRLSLRFDGVEVSNAVLDVAFDAGSKSPFYLGGRPDNVHPASSKLSELVVHRGPLSTSAVEELERYLKLHNGI